MSDHEVALRDLAQALRARGGFELVSYNLESDQVVLMGRVRAPSLPMWRDVGQRLLFTENVTWTIDISRPWLRKGGTMVHAWRIILDGPGVASNLRSIIGVIQSTPRAQTIREVTEMPLIGASPDRNAPNPEHPGKGAGLSGTVPVGQMAVQFMRGG